MNRLKHTAKRAKQQRLARQKKQPTERNKIKESNDARALCEKS